MVSVRTTVPTGFGPAAAYLPIEVEPVPLPTGCMAGCSNDTGCHRIDAKDTRLEFVGNGQGRYVKETEFKYVGDSMGEFDMVERTPVGRYLPWVACVGLGLLGVLLSILVWPMSFKFFREGDTAGTTLAPFDCEAATVDEQEGWLQHQRDWCCKHKQIGCVRASKMHFDCRQDLERWWKAWPEAKRVWCCLHNQLGCPTLAPTESWPPAHRPPNIEAYDCNNDFKHWASNWSDKKKAWCCSRMGRGCRAAATTPAKPCDHNCSNDGPGKGERTSLTSVSTSSDQYNCVAGYAHWEIEWSGHKKAWCCARFQRGCKNRTTTSGPFDCQADDADRQSAWVAERKAWCCKHRNRGCRGTTTPLPYDCLAGVATWRTSWVEQKRRWCCDNRGISCVEEYDCDAGYADWYRGWSDGKKAWCCKHDGRGCRLTAKSIPFDCLAGQWETGWSERKKQWCCMNRGRGCPTKLRVKNALA